MHNTPPKSNNVADIFMPVLKVGISPFSAHFNSKTWIHSNKSPWSVRACAFSRQESDLAEEKKARLTNQEMFSRMLNSMDNIERHLTAICVGDGEETLLELPGVQQVAPTVTDGKMVATKTPDQEVETTQEETIESLSTRVSTLHSMAILQTVVYRF